MNRYEIHYGVELPFWLALERGRYEINYEGRPRQVNVDSEVDRIDVGDFYLGGGNRGSRWVPRSVAEGERQRLQAENPNLPVTRIQSKTILTHVRVERASSMDAVTTLFGELRDRWLWETLDVINKLISVYMLVVGTDGKPDQVGSVALWDLGKVLISFWETDDNGESPRQLGGYLAHVKAELPPPPPITKELEQRVRERLAEEEDLPIIELLHVGAAAQFERGNYRGAVIDDVTAGELAVSDLFRSLTSSVLPASMIDDLVKQRFDSFPRWIRDLDGLDLTKFPGWADFMAARKLRQDITHRGASATRMQALDVLVDVGELLRWLSAQKATS